MPQSPEISVIVPCYNYGHFLPQTLDTVLAQDFSDWECIIVNDGSLDNTEPVSKEYVGRDSRFRYYYQSNAGLSSARNTGLAHSTGKYIQLLDADDGLAVQKLSWQHLYLEQHPEANLVYGDALFFDDDMGSLSLSREGSAKARKGSACGEALLGMLVRNNIMEVSCPLIRRSLIDSTGAFETSYVSFEDWQYWFRAAMAGACFHYAPHPGTETYIRHGHASMMKNLTRMNEAGFMVRSFMGAQLKGLPAWYNRYRIMRLRLKKLWLSLQT